MPQPGYDAPPTATITRRAVIGRIRQLDRESRIAPDSASIRSISEHGAQAAERRARSLEPPHERVEHVGRAVRDREDLAVALDLGRDAGFLEHPHRRVDVEPAQRRAEERSVVAERLLDRPDAAALRGS